MEGKKEENISLSEVRFYTQRPIEFGQAVYVCGNIRELGNWDPRKAPKLDWSKGDNWNKTLILPTTSDIEFKYFISTYDNNDMKHVNWDKGPNTKISFNQKNKTNTIGQELKVMSFNIRYDNMDDGPNRWEFRKDQVAKIIESSGCDFFGIQEALFHQLAELSSLAPSYMHYGRCRGLQWMSGEAAPIFYLHEKWEIIEGNTFWLSDTPNIPASKTFGNTLPRICTWVGLRNKFSGQEILVTNLHTDHINLNARKKSAQMVATFLKNKSTNYENIVLTGDFNATEDEESIEIIKLEGPKLSDSFAKICSDIKKRKLVGTMHEWLGIKNCPKIDYIFVSPNLETKDFLIIYENDKGAYPSDHFPIMATFKC